MNIKKSQRIALIVSLMSSLFLFGCTTVDSGPVAPPPPTPTSPEEVKVILPPQVPIPVKPVEPGKSTLEKDKADQPLYKRP